MEHFVHSAWSFIPFGLMLLTIAIGPMVAKDFWESNRNKLIVTLILAVPTVLCLCLGGMGTELHHQMLHDYIPFIILLTALFIVTGGIHLSGDIEAKPWVNTLFLGAGWLLASVMGTTGASMLLIRPLLNTNKQRKHVVHTVLFFIALVCNCGGLLTPLGDPPLFMLFLRGAPFAWFLKLWPEWLLTGGLLLIMYYFADRYYYAKEHPERLAMDKAEHRPLKLHGTQNLLYLLGVMLAVAFINESYIPAMGAEHVPFFMRYLREWILVALAILSLTTTSREVRFTMNRYSWVPIIEVAILFAGIFITMTPVLSYLQLHTSSFSLHAPWQFYYTTGALSSFLDNTPTAVAFHSVAASLSPEQMVFFSGDIIAGIPEVLLRAISLSSVMFGAMTYIGNGPNFMVKAIAERRGVNMPSFFGYMAKFSLIILLPVYILVQLIFL